MTVDLTVREIQTLRKETEDWMPDLCSILREVADSDDVYGGRGSTTETTVATGVVCLVEPGAGHSQDEAYFAKIEGIQQWAVSVPAGTNVKVGDHLVISSRANLRVRVQAMQAPASYDLEIRLITTETGLAIS